MKGKLGNITLDYKDSKPVITLKLDNKSDLKLIEEFKDIELDIKIKKYSKKRSLNSNSYLWILCQKLADKLEITDLEVYKEHIKELNIYKQFTLEEEESKTFKTAWNMLGIGWICERIDITEDNKVVLKAYYGSSTYNTKQMSRLINNIVEDCKLQNIETLDEIELKRMCNNWK